MDEQALNDAYNLFTRQGYNGTIDQFKKLISTNNQALYDSYQIFRSEGYNGEIDNYKELIGLKKKASSSVSAPDSEVGMEDSQVGFDFSPLTFEAPSVLTPKKQKEYIEEQKGKPAPVVAPDTTPKEPTESDYFEGAFGNVLRGFDKIVPLGLGDFVDDISRSVASGYRQGTKQEEATKLFLSGAKSTPEEIEKFIEKNKLAKQLSPSEELQNYNKIYEEEGRGVWGFLKGIFKNPTALAEMVVSSAINMATNTDALTTGAAAIGTGAGIGATTGAGAGTVALPVIGTVGGAAAGAVLGAGAAVPYAFGLASSVVEVGSTFADGLEEQLGEQEMTKENVKAILENPDKLNEIRNKAIARGAIIGTVDAFTGKLASSVGAKILTKSAAKSATGAATKGAVVKATAAGSGVESIGGSFGEAAARGAIGQEMDTGEILMEGVAELPGGVRSTIQARFAKPSYKVNGEKVTAEQVDELIDTMSPADLAKTKIEIKNDYAGREFKMQDKIVTNSIKEQVRQGNPELNEPSLNAITQLEKDLKGLEGNTTQTGKDKAAAIRTQIKNIQENQLQEEAVAETVVAETPEIAQQRVDRIAEIETIITNDDAKIENPLLEGIRPLLPAERTELQTELETLKSEQDAIQKQATDEGVLRTEQPEMGLQQMGEGNVQPEGVTAGTEEVIADEGTQKVKPIVSLQTQTEEEQLARMEEMFAEQDIPEAPPVSQGTSVTNKPALDQVKSNLKDTNKISIVDSAQKVLTTLQSVLPNFDIVIHDNDGSYVAAMGSINANTESAGNFSYVKNPDGTYVGRIDINLNRANQRTVGHEVAHGIMLKAFGENPDTFKTFKNRIASVLNEGSNKQLSDFASQYAEIDSYEEYLAELTAALEQQEGKIDTTTFQKIAALINELVSQITNGAFTPFQDIKDTKQAVEFFKNISESIRKGEAIKTSDIAAIQEGLSVAIGSPTTITSKAQKATPLTFPKTPLPLSFVTEADKIDINALIKDIADKKQKVWFWMADQLGRGNYYDEVVEGEHYLDAGPSFALDPENRSKGVLWASGLPEKTLARQINEADYIFFISGSPEKAKLFNKRVLNLLEERINKTSNFNAFKDAINKFEKETVELKTMRDALDGATSFKELADSPKRKPFLLALGEVAALKTTPAGSLKELLGSFNAFIDYNELRDGFYKENGFTQNDIMLVGKPTGLGGKAPHSTYEFAIRGEVVGVPDKKVDSWNIMPESLKDKYQGVISGKESKTKSLQTKVIAAETGVVRGLEAQRKSKAQIIGRNAQLSATAKFNLDLAKEMAKNKMSPLDIRLATGWEKGLEGKWRYEIPDGEFKDIDIDDLKREESSEDGSIIKVSTLSDIFNAPDLYQAYPEIKNIKTVFKNLSPFENGSYNIYTNTITINENLYKKNKSEANLTMLHEIQHYIQTKEFFEGGSNPSYAPIMMNFVVEDFKNKVNEQLKKYNNIKKFFSDDNNAIKNAKELYKFTKERYSKINELLLHKDEKSIKNSYKDIGRRFNISDLPTENILENRKADGFNLYIRVAGEVEARNVEYRNKLTPEQRRKTLLSDTENIDREDQILFQNKDLLFTEDVSNMNQKYPVSKSQLTDTNKISKLIKDARAQGFSESVIETFLQRKGLSSEQISTAMGKVIPAAGKIDLSEEILPGYKKLMAKIDLLIKSGESLKALVSVLKNSNEYINATDIQKEKLVRDLRKKLGLKEKSAPLAQRIIGAIRDVTKITMSEKNLLKKQIKDLARGAKNAKNAWVKISSDLSKEIKALKTAGKITDGQVKDVIRKFSKVNMFSQKSIDSFIDYMTKVFANAEYAAKLSAAKNLKKDISKLSKNKEKNANLRDLGSKFIKIDPTMVEDIDAYNDMASKIKEAIKGSTIRGAKVKFADTVNIENATEYINKTIEAQDEMMRQQKVDEIQELMGVDVSDLSYDDMMQLLDSKEPITKYNEGIIRSTIQKMFNIYSTLIDTTLDTGKDPFTDEDIDITKNKRDLIKRFMDMDLTVLSPKQALQAVDALANFFQNRSTAKMEAILAEYTGNANAKKLVKEGIVAQPLKKYWSPKIGRFLGEQTTNLNILFERMFKGFSRGGKVEDASGVTMLKNNKSMAQRESNNIVEKYIAQFYNKTANGEAYNSEYNSTERGLAAFMMRNIIGTEKQMQAEFNRRKGLVEQSIKVLSEGNEKERAKAELYQTVYDNLIGPSKSFNENQKQSDEATNIQQVKDRVDKVNLEGIDFWNKEWADKYEQLSDVSENIYNKVLDKDLNYTPDKFVKLSTETGTVELSNDDSAFHNNNGTIYKKETGVLMTAVKPDKLPTNPKSGETSRYIDLSFDKNNSNSMYDALVDIGTAGPIRQIEGFLNSPDFKKIVPTAEDAKILKERIQLYVGNIRNKNPYSNDELSSMVRGLNRIASIGVGQALGGVFQPVKQMIPVAMNTLINAGNLDMGAIFDSAKNSFINRSGFAISNRGIESQAQVESLNKLIDEASKTKGEKLIKNIEKLNNWWLEKFLVKPDVFIARASWMTYYEQSLKKQGIDPKGIDYNTHEVNQEAAEYAQRMVDRQQNVSDSDLAGKMFSNKEATNQLFVKMLQPFASFRMNQSARFGSDLAVINDKTATPEDKKIAIKSLSGFAVEMATFKMISAGSAILLGSAAKWLMGDDEDEDDYKKRVNNVIKGQVTSSFNDVVSPLPILDKAFQTGGNFLTETMLDIPKESVFSIYEVPKQDYIQSLGLFGIAADRAGQLYDITKLSTTGEYVDDFGNKKTISEEKQKALAYLIGPAILSNVGLAPVEVNSIVRNSIKNAKKGTSGDGALTRSALERWGSSIDLSKMSKVAEFIKSKKEELSGKGDLAEKREFRKELEKDLLGKYEDKAQMRGADPELYKKNFGAESDWVKKGYAAEEILEAKFNTILNKKKNLIKIEELKKQK